jgi:hypothetical protein
MKRTFLNVAIVFGLFYFIVPVFGQQTVNDQPRSLSLEKVVEVALKQPDPFAFIHSLMGEWSSKYVGYNNSQEGKQRISKKI